MNDREKMNALPPEVKLQIVEARTLAEEVKKEMKMPGRRLDLTSQMQLKDDCRAIDTIIRKFAKGKGIEKLRQELGLAVTRLETTSYYILKQPKE